MQPATAAKRSEPHACCMVLSHTSTPAAVASLGRAPRSVAFATSLPPSSTVVKVAVRVDDEEWWSGVAELFSEKLEDKVGVIRRADAGVDQHDEERRRDDVEERVLVEPVL